MYSWRRIYNATLMIIDESSIISREVVMIGCHRRKCETEIGLKFRFRFAGRGGHTPRTNRASIVRCAEQCIIHTTPFSTSPSLGHHGCVAVLALVCLGVCIAAAPSWMCGVVGCGTRTRRGKQGKARCARGRLIAASCCCLLAHSYHS